MAVAVYAGSFDPVTSGHIAIIRNATKLFDRIIVLIADNPEKRTLFSIDERIEMLKTVTANMKKVVCDVTDGIVVEYARDNGACFLVRGNTRYNRCRMRDEVN